MTREDEIMARHLLSGGKMLSKTCPACGCPLFEIKGETLCVVCEENSREPDQTRLPTIGRERETPAAEAAAGPRSVRGAAPLSPRIVQSLEETILHLCLRIRQEDDPEKVLVLMKAVRKGCKSLELLARPGDQG